MGESTQGLWVRVGSARLEGGTDLHEYRVGTHKRRGYTIWPFARVEAGPEVLTDILDVLLASSANRAACAGRGLPPARDPTILARMTKTPRSIGARSSLASSTGVMFTRPT